MTRLGSPLRCRRNSPTSRCHTARSCRMGSKTCWLTGQAAGIAAVLAADSGLRLRDVEIIAIQRELLRQGAYFSPAIEAGLQTPPRAESAKRLVVAVSHNADIFLYHRPG